MTDATDTLAELARRGHQVFTAAARAWGGRRPIDGGVRAPSRRAAARRTDIPGCRLRLRHADAGRAARIRQDGHGRRRPDPRSSRPAAGRGGVSPRPPLPVPPDAPPPDVTG